MKTNRCFRFLPSANKCRVCILQSLAISPPSLCSSDISKKKKVRFIVHFCCSCSSHPFRFSLRLAACLAAWVPVHLICPFWFFLFRLSVCPSVLLSTSPANTHTHSTHQSSFINRSNFQLGLREEGRLVL